MSKPNQIDFGAIPPFAGGNPHSQGEIPSGKGRPVQSFIPGYAPNLGAMKLPCKLTAVSRVMPQLPKSMATVTGENIKIKYLLNTQPAMIFITKPAKVIDARGTSILN